MKAKGYYSEFNLERSRSCKTKQFQDDLTSLEKEAKFDKRIKRINFPCEVQYNIFIGNSYNSVDFYAPTGGWKTDKDFHLTLTKLVRVFKGKFERKFYESTGNYYWTYENQTRKKRLKVTLNNAVKPENCVIIPVKQLVTKYKSVCGEETKKLEVTQDA